MEKLDAFTEGMNSKASSIIGYHIKHMKKPEFKLSENRKDMPGRYINDDYRTLTIETLTIYLTEEQAIKLHEVMEKSLYGETYKELEEKLFDAEAKVDELEERLSYYEG